MIVRALVVVVEVLFWLLVLRLLRRALVGGLHAAAAAARATRSGPDSPQVKAAEDLVLDRVCQTYVRARRLSALTAARSASARRLPRPGAADFCSAVLPGRRRSPPGARILSLSHQATAAPRG